jgi:glycine/D-amino acid oxidase-like deaminating enzyme
VSRSRDPRAPLTPDYQERSLWSAQADPPPIAPHDLPATADVAVVGAGYCGLSAARELARQGRSVVVIERDRLGTGASTRNGGMVIPELKAGPEALTRRYGPIGRRMYDEVNEAFDQLESLIAADAIACDYERTGQLYLAHSPRHVPALAAMADEHGGRLGEAVRFVGRDDLGNEIGSTEFHAGVVIERTGAVHPARLHAGLARLAIDAGADLHDRATATAIETRTPRAPGGYRVVTDRGAVEVADLVLATNAYADGLVPWLHRRVVPIGSFIIATDVLDPAVADAVSPRRRMFVDTKNLLFYWRLSPDGRMVFGGRRSLAPSSIAEARDFLHAAMGRIHPPLAGAPVAYAWGGNVAMTLDRLPHFGRVPEGPATGAIYATGCNGSGVALNTWMGTKVADVLAGGPPPALASPRFAAVPLHRARRAYLPAVGRWYAWQDRRS